MATPSPHTDTLVASPLTHNPGLCHILYNMPTLTQMHFLSLNHPVKVCMAILAHPFSMPCEVPNCDSMTLYYQ